MAAYTDLYKLSLEDSILRQKVTVACIIAAEAIRVENPATQNHSERLVWAKDVLENPVEEAQRMLYAVLAANSGATTNQIQTATDATVQTAVNAAVNLFAV